MNEKVTVYCCFGGLWGTTKKICEIIGDFFQKKLTAQGKEAEIYITDSRSIQEHEIPILNNAAIVFTATSVILDAFRTNVMNFMKKHREDIQSKVSGALIVNLPYLHLDQYIPQLKKQIGYEPDVCMTTGGIVDMEQWRSRKGLVPRCRDNRLPDINPDVAFYGEIMTDDLAAFTDELINKYNNKLQGR